MTADRAVGAPMKQQGGTSLRRFRPYLAYKDSGVEWLGTIPTHWEVRRLKFTAQIEAGQSPASELVTEGLEGLPFLQGNAEFGSLNPVPLQVCDVAPKRAEPGDILLSVRAPVGALNIADQAYGIGRGLCAIKPASCVDVQFCFYVLMRTRSRLNFVATGSTYDAVTASEVGDLPMLLSPVAEQRAIAAFLDRETARIDALVAKKERLIELLQEKRTALITRAVTKGLDPNVPVKDSGVEWLGEIPAHWEVRRLRHVVESVKNGTTANQLEYGETEYRVTRIETISNGVIDLSKTGFVDYAPELDDYRLKTGDLLLSHINSISMLGNCALYDLDVPLYGGMNLLRLRPNAAVSGRWLWNWLRSVFGRESVRSRCKPAINQASVPIGALKSIVACVPPLAEQIAVAAFLDRELARIDALVAKVRDAIDRLKELRTALISAAVTGKIDVRGEAA